MATDTEKEMRRRLKGEGNVQIQHLEQHRRQLLDELSQVHAGDKAERDELNERLKIIEEHISEQKKAQQKVDDVKDSKTTMVVPPNDIPAAQPNVPTHEGETETKKQPFWKRIYYWVNANVIVNVRLSLGYLVTTLSHALRERVVRF